MLDSLKVLLTAAWLIFLTGCAVVDDALKNTFDKPRLSVAGVRIESLSFEAAGLAFDVEVTNPNPISITLAGYDYSLSINNAALASGDQNDKVYIKADETTTVRVPVRLVYKELYQAIASLLTEDEARYQIDFGFSFELPVLGVQRLPVSHTGMLPLPKMPKLAVAGLRLQRLSATGAELALAVQFVNPNAFAFEVQQMSYALEIAGKPWLRGEQDQATRVLARRDGEIELPIRLNFFEVGKSVFSLLAGDAPLQYHFRGSFAVAPAMPLMAPVTLPFDLKGEITLQK